MEYTLSVKDRLVLVGMLPVEDHLSTIQLVRELREGLSFSEAEHEDLQMKQEDNQIRWEEGAIPDKKLEIGLTMVGLIRGILEQMDKDKKIREDHIDICKMFEYEGK